MFKKLSIEKLLAGIAVFVLLLVAGLATYDKCGKQDVIVIVRLESQQDPFVALPQLLPQDSSIRAVREIDRARNEYALTVSTRKKQKDLLDWILNSNGVKDARIKNH